MKMWKWFMGHNVIAPRHPGAIPHVAIGTHMPPAAYDPWLLLPLAGAIVLAAVLLTSLTRRTS